MVASHSPAKISALILAGGQAKRLNGADKGLVPLHGRPLVTWVLARISPQADEILISANRNIDTYRTFGHTVLQDRSADFDGPLAGLLRGLETAKHPLVLCVPCDTPFLPADLAGKLSAVMTENHVQLAVARTHDHIHRAICLCRRELAPHLAAFLEQGGRRVGEWQASLNWVEVFFPEADNFRNFNTPDDLATVAEEYPRNPGIDEKKA